MTGRFAFLFDECLTPDLPGVAADQGYYATHVNFLGLTGASDRALVPVAIERDLIFVTNNGVDFRPLYLALDVHPGLIVLLPGVNAERQVTLFLYALSAIEREGDLMNKLVEVDRDGLVSVRDFSA